MRKEEPTGWDILDRKLPWWAWLLVLAAVAFAAGAVSAQSPSGSASTVLAWDANPPEERVQGYRIEVLETGAAPRIVEAGNVTQFKVTGLKPGVLHRFRVQAYDDEALVSDFSAPVSWAPAAPYGADGACATAAGSAPEVSVIVQSYDLEAKRSDPKGLLVRFDAGSSEAIVEITLDLENDGEPAVPLKFPTGVGFDGRYVRALAFKPTINGTWPLLVTAVDDVGRKASARCLPGVTVGF
jgi:hypothetical protein